MNLRDWVAGERARERARGAELRLRETFPQTGPLGQAFPASPIVRSRRANVPPVNVFRQPPYGRAITVTTSQVFDGGGTACQWSGPVPGLRTAGFTAQTFPNTALTIPIRAYWRLEVTVAWDDYLQGGRVEVFRDGVRLWSDQAPYGAGFDRTFNLGVCFPDEDIVVEVSPVGQAGVQPDGKQATVVASLVLVELPVTVAVDLTGDLIYVDGGGVGGVTGTHTISVPTETREDDMLLLITGSQQGLGGSYNADRHDVGPGWTKLYVTQAISGRGTLFTIWWKRADSSDDGGNTYALDMNVTGSDFSSAAISVYRPGPFGTSGDPFGTPVAEYSASASSLSLTTPDAARSLVFALATVETKVGSSSGTSIVLDEPPANRVLTYMPSDGTRQPCSSQGYADGSVSVSASYGPKFARRWLVAVGVGS